MTEQEHAILQDLTNAWNKFVELPIEHPDQQAEFRTKLHDLQRMIMARPTARATRR